MFIRRPLLALGAILLVSACSSTDSPVGPGPGAEGPPVIQSFIATQTSVEHGQYSQLRWTVEGATVAAISPDLGEVASSGTQSASVRPARSTTYQINASNAHGTASASVTIDVSYPAGVFVDPVGGDDANSGANPDEAIASIALAMTNIGPGESLFLVHGIYDANLVIGTSRLLIYGGLSPETFFEGTGAGTWIQPGSGIPLEVTSVSPVTTVLRKVNFRAPSGAAAALRVSSARISAQRCIFDGTGGAGTAVLLEGASEAEISHSEIRGGGTDFASLTETRGVHATGTTALHLSHCFVSGGSATYRSTGVDLETSGAVTLGLNTIGARITGGFGADNAAAIRIWAGRPAIGGNILFGRATAGGSRHAVVEEAADADPSYFEANLLFSAGTPPYENHSSDGQDAFIQDELNNYLIIMGDPADVGRASDNRLIIGLEPVDMFKNVPQADYHLRSPLGTGSPNPAVDGGLRLHPNESYGSENDDIDGDGRPGTFQQFDRGADEVF